MSRKITLTKKEAKAEPKKLEVKAAPVKKAVATKAAIPSMQKHGLNFNYAGSSQPVVSRKSRTVILVAEFGKNPDGILTDRDNATISALKKKFGKTKFQRGDLDAGVIRRLGERGYVKFIGGDPASPLCEFALTERSF